jgi:membrane associated rhomboid family serine protease
MTPAVKFLLTANVALFVMQLVFPAIAEFLGLSPELVLRRLWVWQPVTYMFLHGDLFHILFNMLALWMLGVELERLWGTVGFLRFYFVSGIGAALTTLVVALLPFDFAGPVWYSLTVGASGAIYGLLLAYAYYYPDRPMLFFPIPIPVPAKYFVLILGAIAFLSSLGGRATGVAHATHLGGLVAGYVYLTRGRGGLLGEIKYRWLKWKMARMRKRFDVVQGGGRGNRWDGYH